MANAPVIYHLPYSNWSVRAIWALDHHHIERVERRWVPMLSEYALRLRLGRMSGKLTAPLLIVDGNVIDDSLEIARWADQQGSAAPLLPPELESEIMIWEELSQRMMNAGRALSALSMQDDPRALAESAPFDLPHGLRPIGAQVAKVGLRFLLRKYEVDTPSKAAYAGILRAGVAALNDALQRGDYLCGERFTWAEIAMCAALQFVQPPDHPSVPMGPAMREHWTRDELLAEAASALEWRDRIYARHRPDRGDGSPTLS